MTRNLIRSAAAALLAVTCAGCCGNKGTGIELLQEEAFNKTADGKGMDFGKQQLYYSCHYRKTFASNNLVLAYRYLLPVFDVRILEVSSCKRVLADGSGNGDVGCCFAKRGCNNNEFRAVAKGGIECCGSLRRIVIVAGRVYFSYRGHVRTDADIQRDSSVETLLSDILRTGS